MGKGKPWGRRSYADVETKCVVCTKTVEEKRTQFGAITCSKECGLIREGLKRWRREQRECTYCHKPSTPEEREEFRRFRKWQEEQTPQEAAAEQRSTVGQ